MLSLHNMLQFLYFLGHTWYEVLKFDQKPIYNQIDDAHGLPLVNN